ncbi:MAG: universal stress protein [Azospirillum sp.]|nr:universal stress protein [Azospirillum sp.]
MTQAPDRRGAPCAPCAPCAPTRTRSPVRIFLVLIDDSTEMTVALKYACRRARRSGGRVALLYVMESDAEPIGEFQWRAVEDLMREEARERAEQVILRYAKEVVQRAGTLPILLLREGDRRAELLKLIEEEPSISILVLAASIGPKGPGPMISYLTSGQYTMKIPMTIVPGSLTDDQLDAIT